ncbi:MAG: transposase [Bacteroidales bacterium]
MQEFENLEPGNLYHIFNKGIDGTNLFENSKHNEHFLHLFEKYIEPVCYTYAWCLMGNHFHLLIQVREVTNIPDWKKKGKEESDTELVTSKMVSQAFSNLFNAYAQYFNHQTKRTGALFQTPFKRKIVKTVEQFKSLVYYIHYNPVKHGFTDLMIDYPWSSYHSIISIAPNKIDSKDVIGWFNSKGEFIDFHKQHHDILEICSVLFDNNS